MSVNSATSSVSSTTATTQVSQSVNTDTSKKTSSDSSFKEEMDKVSYSDKTKETKAEKSENKHTDKSADVQKPESQNQTSDSNNDELRLTSLSLADANSMLSDDIRQMMSNLNSLNGVEFNDLFSFSGESGMFTLDYTNSVNVSESDAKFFVELSKNDNITPQNIASQVQAAIDGGAEFEQVQQNVKISQTLLNAINTARETNQPLRIDFEQNVAVILRMGKDGSFSANFIPGDKAVEQYLKNNIESLKATFDEKDLPYTDLSYSNRGSKQQKEQRRNRE